jgi:hypothetical protein
MTFCDVITSAFFLNACSQASFLNSSWQVDKKYRLYFANFGVCSWGSFGQIKSKGAVHIMFFKKAVDCELAVPVPNLLAMCELAIFYAKCDLAIHISVKRSSQQGIVYYILQIYIGCMSIRKLPIKIVIYYSKMIMIYSKAPHKSSVNFDLLHTILFYILHIK